MRTILVAVTKTKSRFNRKASKIFQKNRIVLKKITWSFRKGSKVDLDYSYSRLITRLMDSWIKDLIIQNFLMVLKSIHSKTHQMPKRFPNSKSKWLTTQKQRSLKLKRTLLELGKILQISMIKSRSWFFPLNLMTNLTEGLSTSTNRRFIHFKVHWVWWMNLRCKNARVRLGHTYQHPRI